jgi:hypothetical protein
LDVPNGSTATVSVFSPEIRLFDRGLDPGPFEHTVSLPGGLASGSYTVVYRVVLPTGEALALHVVVQVGDDGVITSISENLVGLGPLAVAEAKDELSYTGLRSSSLPWWATVMIFMGLILIVYSHRALKMAAGLDSELHEKLERSPWEILATPIRVPGISYTSGGLNFEGDSQSLGEALRDIDVAFSLIIARQIARLSPATQQV